MVLHWEAQPHRKSQLAFWKGNRSQLLDHPGKPDTDQCWEDSWTSEVVLCRLLPSFPQWGISSLVRFQQLLYASPKQSLLRGFVHPWAATSHTSAACWTKGQPGWHLCFFWHMSFLLEQVPDVGEGSECWDIPRKALCLPPFGIPVCLEGNNWETWGFPQGPAGRALRWVLNSSGWGSFWHLNSAGWRKRKNSPESCRWRKESQQKPINS